MVDSGGTTTATGTGFELRSTIHQAAGTVASGGEFSLQSGFWGGALVSCTNHIDCHDQSVCTCNFCTSGVCTTSPIEYGNVNCAGPPTQADIDDYLCALSGFSNFQNCPNADIYPACTGNRVINLDDILVVSAAFMGGADPCGCVP